MAAFRVLFCADDYEGVVAFLTDTLGLAVDRAWDDPDGRGTIVDVTGGGQIEVFDRPAGPVTGRPTGTALAWQVDDADAWHDRLVAAGVTVTAPPADRPWGHRNTSFVVPGLDLHVTLFHELAPIAPEA